MTSVPHVSPHLRRIGASAALLAVLGVPAVSPAETTSPPKVAVAACIRLDRDGDSLDRIRFVLQNEPCRRFETRVQLQGTPGPAGPQGPAGAVGPTGPRGPAGAGDSGLAPGSIKGFVTSCWVPPIKGQSNLEGAVVYVRGRSVYAVVAVDAHDVGTYELGPLAPGEWDVTFRVPSTAPRTIIGVVVEPGQTTPLDADDICDG